jgi:hypothetical protein
MKTLGKNHSSTVKILEAQKSLIGKDSTYLPFIKSLAKSLLREEDEAVPVTDGPAAPDDFSADKNAADYQASLEPETAQNQFDTEGVDPNMLADAITSVKEWADKLDEFTVFLNDPKTQSLHKSLAAADRAGSLVRGITRKTSDSITRIAGEVAKLKEILNGFINMAPKKQRDTDALVASTTA